MSTGEENQKTKAAGRSPTRRGKGRGKKEKREKTEGSRDPKSCPKYDDSTIKRPKSIVESPTSFLFELECCFGGWEISRIIRESKE